MKLTIKEKRVFKNHLKIETISRYIDRIRIILLLNEGWTSQKIATAFFIDERTVRNYKSRYVDFGIEGLINDGHKGRVPILKKEEEEKLDKLLKKKLFKSVSELISYVEKEFGVRYSRSGMRYLLHRLHFSFKKSKGVPAKADITKQKRFLRYYRTLISRLRKKGLGMSVYFADAAHPTHSTSLGYGWIKTGENFWVKTPGGRFRLNIHGALCIESLDVVSKTYQTIDRHAIRDFLETLRDKHPNADDKIYFICDNASYYTANDVRTKANELNIKLIFLPPYSPNLNLIERLWKFMKKKIFSKYLKTREEFKASADGFFRDILKYKSELRTLLTENFQILDASFASS